jgi:hypothetical protein
MPYVVRAFPLVRPVEELRDFAAELAGNQREEADRFYRNYGVTHESWHLQLTPHGPWVIGVTVVDDPGEAASRYAGASEAFHAWFKQKVLHCTGVDPNVTPLGPPTTQIFCWSADET